MSDSEIQENLPPKLRPNPDGGIDNNSLADVVEWFLNFDERTARMRHPYTEQLFQWKQQDDAANGVGVYPFENAEARFAIGVLCRFGRFKVMDHFGECFDLGASVVVVLFERPHARP